MHHLQAAFEEASLYSRYHPNKGYTWDFSSNKVCECLKFKYCTNRISSIQKISSPKPILVTDKSKTQMKKEPEKAKEEPSSMFQRQRVDMLLGELMRKFPLPMMTNPNAPPPAAATAAGATGAAASADQSAATNTQRPDLKESPSTNNNNQNGEFKPPEKRAK